MTIATNSPTILSARSNWLADPYAAIQLAGCAATQQMARVKTWAEKSLRQIAMVNVVLRAADHCTDDYPPMGQSAGSR